MGTPPGNLPQASVDRTSPLPAHTPGPWSVGPTGHVLAPSRKTHIGFVSWAGEFLNRVGEAKANARLIAAAPELLEALFAHKAASDFVASIPLKDSPSRDQLNKADRLVGRATRMTEAAIAKATGTAEATRPEEADRASSRAEPLTKPQMKG